jgi:hypothetical protein
VRHKTKGTPPYRAEELCVFPTRNDSTVRIWAYILADPVESTYHLLAKLGVQPIFGPHLHGNYIDLAIPLNGKVWRHKRSVHDESTDGNTIH